MAIKEEKIIRSAKMPLPFKPNVAKVPMARSGVVPELTAQAAQPKVLIGGRPQAPDEVIGGNPAFRESDAILYGPNTPSKATAPLSALVPKTGGQAGAIRTESGRTAVLNQDNSISTYDDATRVNNVRKQTTLSRPGIQRVGNMDVQFDGSVDNASRQAFMRNPVRPTAQINRYDANQLLQQQMQEKPRGIEKPKILTAENTPNMGWHQRMSINEQNLKNWQADKDMAAQERMDRSKTSLDREKFVAGQPLQSAQIAEAKANTEEKQMSIAEAKQIQALTATLANPKTSPLAFRQAKTAMQAIRAKSDQRANVEVIPPQETEVWENGQVVKKKTPAQIVDKDTGYARDVQTAPPAPPTMPEAEAMKMLEAAKGTPEYDELLQFYKETYQN